jgi:hypothetical protein
MEQFLSDNGKKVSLLMENALIQLETIILEHGKTANQKAKVRKSGMTAESTKAYFTLENL